MTHSDGGKGSGRRPGDGYGNGWERTFRQREPIKLAPSVSLVRLHRDAEGTVIHSEEVEPIPAEIIAKNFGGWTSLEEIVRWVEEFHGIGGKA